MKKLIEENEEIKKKKAQNQLKNQEICTNFKLQTHFQDLQNNVSSISEVYISIYH